MLLGVRTGKTFVHPGRTKFISIATAPLQNELSVGLTGSHRTLREGHRGSPSITGLFLEWEKDGTRHLPPVSPGRRR